MILIDDNYYYDNNVIDDNYYDDNNVIDDSDQVDWQNHEEKIHFWREEDENIYWFWW